jgi:hypothetical protein
MKMISKPMHGYSYGDAGVGPSPVSVEDLASLKVSVGFTDEDERYLRMAGEVLAEQTKAVVDEWRNGIIAGIPNLARHSRALDGKPIPEYAANSGLPSTLRPGLDQLPAGNRIAAYIRKKEHGRQRSIYTLRSPP